MSSEKIPPAASSMQELVWHKDWSTTPLGSASGWPQSLRTSVDLCLASRFPSVIFWGPERVQIYNDGYRVILGTTKHPQALGQRAQECWAEIWDRIEPLMASVFDTGEAVWLEDSQFSVERHGYLEEAFFTFSYTPIRDESGAVGGIFETVAEVTPQIVALRRLAALRELGESLAGQGVDEACATAARTLARHTEDVPFALLYQLDDDAQTARLRGHAGLDAGLTASLASIRLGPEGPGDPWPLADTLRTREPSVSRDLALRLGPLPGGPWPEPTDTAVLLPLELPAAERPFGVLVAGVSPRRKLDPGYVDFLSLVAQGVSRSIGSAAAYQQERRRAETLAELNRAKTAFFSNVSHELRTPLTLILGPLEDALSPASRPLQGEALETVHRSALRLLRLVNSLLDFARLEAGRPEATFVPTDLALLTSDLASSFRALVERAGLRLVLDCPPLPEPVYVDPGHWERIVLNLLSNAFKFTFAGEIRVCLGVSADHVELAVRDTGIGIPSEKLPHVFERFYRVEGARGRSIEGTGIGLSLVQELARLHGGAVRVSSTVDEGSSFEVSIPRGSAHLSPEQIGSHEHLPAAARSDAAAYLLETEQWSAAQPGSATGSAAEHDSAPSAAPEQAVRGDMRGRILVVDDNADLRGYLARILSPHWNVELAGDGEMALASARAHPPDLVLSDMMMPRLDGAGLLRALRADSRTRQIPIVLLSARAGEEALVEGLGTGADDYLAKPFSARELLARVRTHLEMARMRREWAHELEHANQELESFSYSVSHDLRAPVRAIDGFTRSVLEDPGRQLDESARRDLSRVRAATQRMNLLIDDLLQLSRISRAPLQRERINLSEVAARILAELQTQTPERVAEIEIARAVIVRADPRLLQVVLENLLRNAWKFTARRGHARIEVGEQPGGERIFFVRDNGAGFDMQYAPKLFTPFQRLHSDADYEGTGVGLATVQRIVSRHYGRVWAEAVEGQGATFFFTLGEAL